MKACNQNLHTGKAVMLLISRTTHGRSSTKRARHQPVQISTRKIFPLQLGRTQFSKTNTSKQKVISVARRHHVRRRGAFDIDSVDDCAEPPTSSIAHQHRQAATPFRKAELRPSRTCSVRRPPLCCVFLLIWCALQAHRPCRKATSGHPCRTGRP